MGLSIWGDKKLNNLLTIFGRVLKEFKIDLNQRSSFYLNPLIDDLVLDAGWGTVLKW